MPSFTIALTLDAPIERVWRALCDPSEVVQWDATVAEALDAPLDYPRPGQHVRWRIEGSDEVLHDRPQHVEPPTLLHSLLAIGHEHLDETYTLTAVDGRTTALACYVSLSSDTPPDGLVIASVRTLSQTRTAFATSLANLKYHCETSS